ncbi:MAG TPA: hypothetical protein VNN25_20610 [Thermoanaerobaculia bacterium]|nr:hypothetical protein [Thermoanaerobaculia bacterium]
MKRTFSDEELRASAAKLDPALTKFMARFPGESGARQPVHTVYGGAHLFKSDTTQKLGVLALRALDEYGPDAATLGNAIGLDSRFRDVVYARVTEKLRREPVEDFRIDFEDGYGNRADAEEDGHAEAAAREVAAGMKNGTLPPFIGIRIKQFSQELMPRSMRTMDIFITTLLDAAGSLPPNFVVTLPKIQLPQQVTALADLFDAMEPKLGLDKHALRFEFMIETTQAILSENGVSNLPLFLDAARPGGGRTLRDVRLHRELQHYRGASADGPSRLRLRTAHDAGRLRRHRPLALRRCHEHHAHRPASRNADAAAG